MTRPPENVNIFGISRREITFYRLRRCDFVPKSPGGSMTLPYNGFTKMHDKFLKSEAVLQTKAPSDEGRFPR